VSFQNTYNNVEQSSIRTVSLAYLHHRRIYNYWAAHPPAHREKKLM